jgi:hypothetical protein
MTAQNSNQWNASTVSPDRKASHSMRRHLLNLSSNRPGQTDIRRNGLQNNTDRPFTDPFLQLQEDLCGDLRLLITPDALICGLGLVIENLRFLITVHNQSSTCPVLDEVIKTLEHKTPPKLSTARPYTTFTAQTRSKTNEYHQFSQICSYVCPSLYAWENFMILGDVSGQVACMCDVQPRK